MPVVVDQVETQSYFYINTALFLGYFMQESYDGLGMYSGEAVSYRTQLTQRNRRVDKLTLKFLIVKFVVSM